MNNDILLAGDIGATKTILALFLPDKGLDCPLVEMEYPSNDYVDLGEIVFQFLESQKQRVKRACFGVAGPVVAGRTKITKLPWKMDEEKLMAQLNFDSVSLINDLVSTACAIPVLGSENFHPLNDVAAVEKGAIGVIAPGTGLGESFMIWDGNDYLACPSEGGHVDFAPANSHESELLDYLRRKHDHVSFDRLCSGRGIPDIYSFLKESGFAEEPAWMAERLKQAGDPAPVIVANGLDESGSCKLCNVTLEMFVSILGAASGNLALKVLATGGIYLGGGIPPKILPALQTGTFLRSFQQKGRMTDLMTRIPVKIILNPRASLIGAAHYGLSNT